MAGIRIQKLLADAGYCSRRKAEALIEQGRVKRNGRPVKLGDMASPKDLITVDGERIAVPRKKVMRYLRNGRILLETQLLAAAGIPAREPAAQNH